MSRDDFLNGLRTIQELRDVFFNDRRSTRRTTRSQNVHRTNNDKILILDSFGRKTVRTVFKTLVHTMIAKMKFDYIHNENDLARFDTEEH